MKKSFKTCGRKNGIYSNANNSRSMQRNQNVFGDRKEYLSSLNLNVLRMNLVSRDIEV